MSYEGRDFYILKDGSLVVHQESYGMVPPPDNVEWEAHVNDTNGYEEDDITTHEPKYEEISFREEWKEDHYGNKYAVKIPIYGPVNGPGCNPWRRIQNGEK